ncbi:MAG: NAD(P)/FAD-dependent oxidoreductase [Myxococcales bacterium]
MTPKPSPHGTKPDHDILIIGTGFAGLGMAIQLKKSGFHDFVLIEKEPDVGGTWLVNRYPGCACDVQSHLYSFSFEPNADWSREFATQPEILAYLRRCTDKHALRSHVQFGTQVVGARYDDQAQVWRIILASTDEVDAVVKQLGLKPGEVPASEAAVAELRTRTVSARVLVSGLGGLSTPAYPNLPGIEDFRGVTFHSQRWREDYDLRGKRVAVIGTGASAIQFVPQIQPLVAQLDVYQRTPPWILPKFDRSLGWLERWFLRNVPGVRALRRLALYLRLEARAVAFMHATWLLAFATLPARLYLRLRVRDPVLRRKLTPKYSVGCKRVLLSNDWLPALTAPNVSLVSEGAASVKQHSVVDASGVERPADAIIFGTGFRVSDPIPSGLLRGRDGRDLAAEWKESGPEAYKGTTINGFPNLFVLVGPNTAIGHTSLVYMIESQIRYVMSALEYMRKQGVATLEVKRAAQTEFNREIQRRSAGTVFTAGGCRSYYLDAKTSKNIAIWPDYSFRFRQLTRRFDPQQYHLSPATCAQASPFASADRPPRDALA